MGEPRIIVGEGFSKEKVQAAMALIMTQVLASGLHSPLPTIKRLDKGPFNKSKEQERRIKQIQRIKEKRENDSKRIQRQMD